jgi:hypothetical protein
MHLDGAGDIPAPQSSQGIPCPFKSENHNCGFRSVQVISCKRLSSRIVPDALVVATRLLSTAASFRWTPFSQGSDARSVSADLVPNAK